MSHLAALIYWPIVAGWAVIAIVLSVNYAYYSRKNATVGLLIAVIIIDSIRNIIENTYFGMLWGSMYGIFPASIAQFLSKPSLLIIPKVFNVVAIGGVLTLLLLRYLPQTLRENKRMEADLHDSEQRFRMLVDGVKEYAIYSLDPDGKITSWNLGAERIKGYTAAEAVGMNVAEFYTPADQLLGLPALALSKAREEGQYEMHAERVRKDGSTFWAHITISAIHGSQGDIIGFAKVTKDITQSHTAAKMLEYQASHDRLTGLSNRASLFDDMRSKLSQGKSFGLAIFDLDGFKDVNDTYGHIAGDRLLQQVARRFTQQVGPSNLLYRLGGDEFVLLATGQDSALDLVACSDRLLKGLEEAFVFDGALHHISASVGIALASHELDPEAILANADLALYDAKASGGRRHSIYVPAMRARLQARRSLDAQLRRAYENGEFELYYQPQVLLKNGVVVAAEALLRWNHPEHGLIKPPAFIDALAASPIALDCGRWILEDACATLSQWRAQGLPVQRVGVNLFPAHFYDQSLEGDVENALAMSGLSGDMLELEITENIALQQDSDILAVLHRLRKSGVKLAFDDFGTGYASLSCLTRYPLTRIKIDRSFISPISADREATEAAIVRPMITMAHYLGLEVIAEGIETVEQIEFLRTLGCEEGQGFYYGQPVRAHEFAQFVERQEPERKTRMRG